MKQIGWYTRDGHLDFFAKLSRRLGERTGDVHSHYVCHTSRENELLRSRYGISASVLAQYLDDRRRSFSFSEAELRSLERRYDTMPFRRLVWSQMYERPQSEEQLIFYLVVHFEFWEQFLDRHGIEVMVSERPSILSTSVLWLVCKARHIRSIDFNNIGIDGRIVTSSGWYGDIDNFAETFASLTLDENSEFYARARRYLDKMTTNPEKPEYIFQNVKTGEVTDGSTMYYRLPRLFGGRSLLSRWRNARGGAEYYNNATLGEWLSKLASHRARAFLHRFVNVFDDVTTAPDEPFFLFPLHANREWSNYPWMGIGYPRIVARIQEISACLPLDTWLYVKEHTSDFPDRSLATYRALRRDPRVRLLPPRADTFALLRRCRGLVTFGGTTGWEAYLMGKPVIILTDAWYKTLPGVYRAETPEALAALLQQVDHLPRASEEEKMRAICALYAVSFEAKRYPLVDLVTDQNVDRYAVALARWIDGPSMAAS